jgi:hypothetical protein
MIVRRKFNLSQIGKNYETIDIEVDCPTVEECIQKIEEAWRTYCKAIVDGKVT